jgi:hypothetical protein
VYTKTRLICGKEFQSKAINTRYCSRECRLEARRRRSAASRGLPKTLKRMCENCGERFETIGVYRKYCSDECRQLATVKRKRAKREKKQGTKGHSSEDVFIGLCSVCGADTVFVSECPECGFLSCEKCRNLSGLCNICLRVLNVPAI